VTAATSTPSTRARRWGFRTVAYSLMIVLLGANQPTPLYALYQRVDRLSTTTLTLLFIAYVLAVALALVLAGQLSDRYGRRAVLLPALALALTSAAAFALSSGLVWLLVGRITSGLASGAVTALAPAALAELEVDRDLDRAPVVASTATVLGLALGRTDEPTPSRSTGPRSATREFRSDAVGTTRQRPQRRRERTLL